MRRRNGQALIYAAILMLLFIGFAALVVDGARNYFAARETQGAADVAAIGGTLALIETGSSSDGVAGAQEAGNYPAAGYPATTLNVVNGQPASIDASNISVGNWGCSPCGSCTPTFQANVTPYNAVRVTPTFPINNLIPLWQTVSHPDRNATAAWLTIGTGTSCIPLLLGNCFTCYSDSCSSDSAQTQIINFASGGTGNTNATWYYPGYPCGGSCGTTDLAKYVPGVCNGTCCNTSGVPQPAGGLCGPTMNLGSTVHATHGSITSVCKDFGCLVGNQYLVGVMGTSCGVPTSGTQTVTGFATVKILGVNCSSGNSWGDTSGLTTDQMKVQAQFIDCSKPANAPICSSQLTSCCPGCGTGFVVLVE